ncbi:MAG: acetate--CoA ligase family protein [Candidatus Eisenbacteria bacterium]|uniref:Acetate--CoA ligase family protein n=1 Tax=Eiseniibacteriota bacterium TaxID=2212470 RepID=A0A937X9W9_UNCEI|nr:acetate--CoA ligase family protein [Candidatus Eisenbacteria bacterium]
MAKQSQRGRRSSAAGPEPSAAPESRAAAAEPGFEDPAIQGLDALLKPRSVAIIGASPRPDSIGRVILHNIIEGDFNGVVYPVHPKAAFVHSMKTYPSVLAIPDEVDLAYVVVPGAHVLPVVDECGRKGVRSICVISAGFREIGGEGIRREEELLDLVRRHGMRMVGPNCLGLISMIPGVRLNGTFAPARPRSGGLAFLSQSGALGVSILQHMERLDIGFSYFVSIGNSADIRGRDLLAYWEDDPHTEVIALYVESFGDPRVVGPVLRRITRRKPVVIVKSGRTAAGMRAASSHTGAMSAADETVDAFLRQTGAIRAYTIEEMLGLLTGFCRAPVPRGKRVAVLTNSGGPGIMATDALVTGGMEMAQFSEKTSRILDDMLPPEASRNNPIDLTAWGVADTYRQILPILFEDPNIDIILALFVPPMMVNPADAARAIAESRRGRDKPIFGVIMAEESSYRMLPREVPDCPPIFPFPEMAVKACIEMYNYHERQQRPRGRCHRFEVRRADAQAILDAVRARGGGFLPTADCMRVLDCYGFPTAPMRETNGIDEALAAAEALGYPVAFKVAGRMFVHKSDQGLVILNLKNELELQGAYSQVKRRIEKLGFSADEEAGFVQKMVKPGREVILGVSVDPKMGPVILFGMGGKYVEVLKDVTVRIPPLTDVDTLDMFASIRGYPLLQGVRGEPGVALDLLQECLLRLSQMVIELEGLVELDINPFVLNPARDDCAAVDARIRVEGAQA